MIHRHGKTLTPQGLQRNTLGITPLYFFGVEIPKKDIPEGRTTIFERSTTNYVVSPHLTETSATMSKTARGSRHGIRNSPHAKTQIQTGSSALAQTLVSRTGNPERRPRSHTGKHAYRRGRHPRCLAEN